MCPAEVTKLDSAYGKAKEIFGEAAGNLQNIKTEEDAKLQIITRLLTDVLGWDHKDIRAEQHHDNGHSDYVLYDNESACVVVEAKKVGVAKLGGAETDKLRILKIGGPALKDCLKGIEQAVGYAVPNGIQIAVFTDGLVWVVLKTFIPGQNYKDKQAFVFPSFEAILDSFEDFFDLLAKDQFRRKCYQAKFDAIHNRRLLLGRPLVAPVDRSEIHLEKKSDLAFDLEPVFARYFDRLTSEDDDMLVDCFVETKESRIADFSLEKITVNVLGNLVSADKDVDRELSSLIEQAVEIETGQTIFIVGPTGAGKSTFLTRFFRRTLSPPIRKQCLVTRVNCLDFGGVSAAALNWLTETLIESVEFQVYGEAGPKFSELQGLYNHEYQRRIRGVDAKLYERDKDEFKEKFGRLLEGLVEEDREGYLRRILIDIVRNRKQLPIFVIDNTDEFPIDQKTQIFQFCQALARHAGHCLLIFPVTDKSAWSFSKTDIFGIYQSRSFFLPTPPPREIFRKRIGFLKDKLSDDSNEESRKSYFVGKGINVSIRNLGAFAQVIESVFVDQDYTSRTIGELTNYNIRRTLLLSKRIITSSVFDIEDLLKSYYVGDISIPNYSKFLNALIKGDYSEYLIGDCAEIFPVFEVDSQFQESPLMVLRVLALLDATRRQGRTADSRHLRVQSIVDYFEAAGCSEDAVDRALLRLFDSGLVEAFDLSVKSLSPSQKLAISHSGRAHLRLATLNNVFFEQMALVTPIANEETARMIADEYRSPKPIRERMYEVRRLFLRYLFSEDRNHISMNTGLEQYANQAAMFSDLRKLVTSDHGDEEAMVALLGDDYKFGVFKKSASATVDWFDRKKGFGFVDVDGVDGKVFLHASKLDPEVSEQISDGDRLTADIRRDRKGVSIDNVHDVDIDVETVEVKVIRLFPDRRYGFVRTNDGARDAFFHYSVLDSEKLDELTADCDATVEIRHDTEGRLQVRRFISIG